MGAGQPHDLPPNDVEPRQRMGQADRLGQGGLRIPSVAVGLDVGMQDKGTRGHGNATPGRRQRVRA